MMLHKMSGNKGIRKISENVLIKLQKNVVNFACMDHDDWGKKVCHQWQQQFHFLFLSQLLMPLPFSITAPKYIEAIRSGDLFDLLTRNK